MELPGFKLQATPHFIGKVVEVAKEIEHKIEEVLGLEQDTDAGDVATAPVVEETVAKTDAPVVETPDVVEEVKTEEDASVVVEQDPVDESVDEKKDEA